MSRYGEYGGAYVNRGVAHLYSGSVVRAQADLKRAVDLGLNGAYTVLWLDLAERRNSLPSRLKQLAAHLDLAKTPGGPFVRLFLGELTPEQALTSAEHAYPKSHRLRVCIANFYAGKHAQLNARKDEAVRLFRLAAADCPPIIEWPAARAELRLLGVEP